MSVHAPHDVPEALPDTDPQKQVILNFQEGFLARYGRLPGPDEPAGYDAALIVAEALRVANPDLADLKLARSQIRDALEQVRVTGAFWTYAFTPEHHDGTWLHPRPALITIEGGKPKFVKWIEHIELLQYL